MTTFKNRSLCSLKFASGSDYDANLLTLCTLIEGTPENALVVAPEVCLTNFDYACFEDAADFATVALKALLPLCEERIVVLTLIERRREGVFNVAKVLYGGKVVHEQAKSRLFHLGEEHHHFCEGSVTEVRLVDVAGIKLGVLICFELRFKTLWQQLEGADVIVVPAQWGKLRTSHFITLTEALALMNQCYVVASDSANADTSGQSGIITPFGDVSRNGNAACLKVPYEVQTVQRMRRYLDVGMS